LAQKSVPIGDTFGVEAVKMGIKEFRERISEVTAAGEAVVITNHGKPVASYAPFKPKTPDAVRRAAEEIRLWQESQRAQGVDLDAILADLGMDPWGEPLSNVSNC
jgi:antitoxin (DNA-binding transcriptional repressor) of toxin-antitoxin stability system